MFVREVVDWDRRIEAARSLAELNVIRRELEEGSTVFNSASEPIRKAVLPDLKAKIIQKTGSFVMKKAERS